MSNEKMEERKFWDIIERAREDSNSNSDLIRDNLRFILAGYTPNELFTFQNKFMECLVKVYTNKIWAAAYLINGGASIDGFYYFRAGLISLGKEAFEKVILDPDSLADIWKNANEDLECEEAIYVAPRLYEEKTSLIMEYETDPEDNGIWPNDDEWEESDLPNILPKLYKIYGE